MEPQDPGLASYYHHQQQRHPHLHHQPPPPPPPQPSTTTTTPLSPITNGILPDGRAPQMLYPHNSVPSAVSSPPETGGRRKRGRPRKYGTPEQAAAAKRLSSSSSQSNSSVHPMSPPRKKDLSLGVGSSVSTSSSSKKASFGNAGQGFTPHVITVTAGEDIGHRIMLFMQQSKQEICVMSASGSISNASLRQPATSGGNITYEGRFDILSLCGSYIRTDYGSTTGGLSVCLSSNDGQIIGGGVEGPLIAAGPVQVIVGTFVIDGKKNDAAGIKGEASGSKLPSPTVGPPAPSIGFLSPPDSSGRNAVGGSDDQQNIDGYPFMIRPMPVTSPRLSDWRSNSSSRTAGGYDFSGKGARQSPENGDYDHFQD